MIKNRIVLSVFAFLFYGLSHGQTLEKVVVFKQDPQNLYNFEQTDVNNLFYLKLVPKTKPIACLVILPSMGEQVENAMKQITLHTLAVEQGFLVLFPSLNWGTNKFDAEHAFLDTIFKQVVEQYKIPKDQFVIGGFSKGGMVSLTYAEKACKDNKSTFLKPRAVFALDPPLDFAHLYQQAERDVERNFSAAAVSEAEWIMNMYRTEFGGSPAELPNEYVKYSIYSHSEKDGGNAKYLLKTPIRIYTEPEIDWQIKYKHRDLYDLNCTDISAMVNLLQTKGNDKVEMIITHDKGVRLDGTKHPHSWSIMDSKDCLTWIMKQLK